MNAYQVQKFQEQERSKLFFISLKAGGVGLNITKASYVLDPWWNPLPKSKDWHRIGQLNKVNVVRFITKTPSRKNHSVTRKQKLLSDALLDETTSALKLKKI
jgi:non-specific serine/threonine protein kinase